MTTRTTKGKAVAAAFGALVIAAIQYAADPGTIALLPERYRGIATILAAVATVGLVHQVKNRPLDVDETAGQEVFDQDPPAVDYEETLDAG